MQSIKPQVEFNFNPCVVEYLMCVPDHSRMDTIIGKTIANKLKSLDKTQGWLAEEVGVSVNAVSKWTRTGKISRENAIVVAKVLDLSLDQLVGRSPEFEEPEDVALERVSQAEAELLQSFRQSTKDGKELIRIMAESAPKAVLAPLRRNKA